MRPDEGRSVEMERSTWEIGTTGLGAWVWVEETGSLGEPLGSQLGGVIIHSERKHRMRRGEGEEMNVVELGFPNNLSVSISRESLINLRLHLEETLLSGITNLTLCF